MIVRGHGSTMQRFLKMYLTGVFIFLGTLFPLFTLQAAVNLTPEERAFLESHGPVVFVSQSNYPPFEFVHNDSSRDGMTIELAHWLATEVGFRARFVDMSFAEAQQAIQSGQANVLTSFFYSKERDRTFDFTTTLFEVPAAIFVSVERPDIVQLKDLTGKRIAMQQGDYAYGFLAAAGVTFEMVPTRDFSEAITALIEGRADAIIGDEQIVYYYLFSNRRTDRVKKVGEPLYVGLNSMAVKEGQHQLVAILNKGIAFAQDSGVIDRLNQKWIGVQFSSAQSLWPRIWPYLAIAGVLLLFVSAWSLRLRQVVKQKTRAISAGEVRYRELYEALSVREERLNCALTGANCGLWDWNIVNNSLYYDRNYYRMAGYLPDAFPATYEQWQERVHPEDRETAEQALKDCLTGQTPTYMTEFRFLTADGSWLWILDKGEIVEYTEEGAPLRFIGLHVDISKQKKTELALRDGERKYRTLLNAQHDAIYLHELDEKGFTPLLEVNAAMVKRYGYSRAELSRMTVLDLLTPERRLPQENNFNRRILLERGHHIFATTHLTRAGLEVPVEVSLTIINRAGKRFVLSIARDITERHTAERQQRELEAQLRQKYKVEAIGLMAGGMAHNFNNNLAIILGSVELAQRKLEAEHKVGPLLANIKTAALRSRDLVQQVLVYSRKGVINKEQLQPVVVVNETLKLLKLAIPSSINVTSVFAPECSDLCIRGDATQIQDALINLCNNAVHAMEEQGELNISVSRAVLGPEALPAHYLSPKEGFVRIAVVDTGCGMSAELQEKIFDPFFTTKDIHAGTGMGLATVQGIMDQHGGLVKVTSLPGKGSTFALFFPIVDVNLSFVTFADMEPAGGTERILFVDDDAVIAELGKQMLEHVGYQVTVAVGGPEALQLFRQSPERFDLVLTDQTMPDLSGRELIVQLLQLRPDLPIILCTGYSSRIDASGAKALGARAFVLKPLKMLELLARVRQVLDTERDPA